MIRQKQKYDHTDANNGDCYRTAIAIITGVSRDSVPHFFEEEGEGYDAVDRFLVAGGYRRLKVFYPADLSFVQLLEVTRNDFGDVPVIIIGKSKRGVNHAAVVQDGQVVCDPATGLEGDCDTLTAPAECDPLIGDHWSAQAIIYPINTEFEDRSCLFQASIEVKDVPLTHNIKAQSETEVRAKIKRAYKNQEVKFHEIRPVQAGR